MRAAIKKTLVFTIIASNFVFEQFKKNFIQVDKTFQNRCQNLSNLIFLLCIRLRCTEIEKKEKKLKLPEEFSNCKLNLQKLRSE